MRVPTSIFNSAAARLESAQVIDEVVDYAATEFGDRIAVRDRSSAITFTELRDRSRSFAAALLRRGLSPGDRVLEALPNGIDLVVSDLGLAAAGLVRVPLNPRLGPTEWDGIAADSGARGLIVDPELTGPDGSNVSDHVHVEVTVCTDEFDALCTSDAEGLLREPVGTNEVIGLAYSSGTTGMPKGAMRTHRMRLASMRAMLRDVLAPTGTAGAYLHAGPAIHTSGLFILPMLAVGAPQVLADHAGPAEIAQLVADEQITHLAVVPSVIGSLVGLSEQQRQAFGGVRMLAYAGAPMPAAHIRVASERLTPNLVQYYGLVEAMPPLAVLTVNDHVNGLNGHPEILGTAGHIVEEAQISITGGPPGEIAVCGPMVTPGYWNAHDRQDLGKSFDSKRLLTGDIGSIENGVLKLTDRKNDMIISGGYNVYPSEVEAAVAEVAAIREAVVVGLPDERWGQRITLVYTTAASSEPSEAERIGLETAIDVAVEPLAKHKRPKSRHHVSSLPLGATGKIDRRAVIELLTADAARVNDAYSAVRA